MSEEYDTERNPGNPRLNETFQDYTDRLKRFVTETIWPPGTEFKCIGCGDCCTWHFYKFRVAAKLVEDLKVHMPKPHGHWQVEGDGMRLVMPLKEEGKTFFFKGKLPSSHLTFHKVTGRLHGYWVLNEDGYVLSYSPVPCVHLNEENLCDIYEERPQVCRSYICRKYPVLP